MKTFMLACAAGAAMLAAPLSAATIVNVDGKANSSLAGGNAVQVALEAGTYKLSFTQDAFTAFSRWSGESNCNADGAMCRQGWENSVRILLGDQNIGFGDRDGTGNYGPIPSGGWYQTAALSFANAAAYTTQFTLQAPGNVGFYIYDNAIGDNRGGVSLSISAVPEPATWAMLIMGFGAVGMASRRRRAHLAVGA